MPDLALEELDESAPRLHKGPKQLFLEYEEVNLWRSRDFKTYAMIHGDQP